MNRFAKKSARFIVAFLGVISPCLPLAKAEPSDPGRAEIGQLHVSVLYATNGDPELAGKNTRALSPQLAATLKNLKHLEFKNFRALGSDKKPILKSYENWAEPLKPSDEILLRFESSSEIIAHTMTLDLELWLSRKKVLKTNIQVTEEKPLYIKGPTWREGVLIVVIELIDEKSSS